MKKPLINQREMRQGIDVGSRMNQVSPASYWYKQGHFKNEDEARGAFKLSYQQGMDGMGKSVQEWMGMTTEEFDSFMRHDSIPRKSLQEVAINDGNMVERWVACLDIMGVKKLIKEEYWLRVFDVYAEAMNNYRRDAFDGHLIRRITFSDSFILYAIDGSALSYRAIDSFVRHFFVSLISKKIPIRGAMSFGELYADDANALYFGKALVEAYKTSECQDWIGYVLCDTASVQLKKVGLPANERLNYAEYPVPFKSYENEKVVRYERLLPSFIIGESPSMKGQERCRKALMSMAKEYKGAGIERKYRNTLEFLDKNIREVVKPR
jgi:hypothetical protein